MIHTGLMNRLWKQYIEVNLDMNIDRVIELQKEQLERYKALKSSCSTCIDDEVIEAQLETINVLLYYRELIK